MSHLDMDLLTREPCSILLTSTSTHASAFLLPHFLKAHLQSGVHVLLVTVNNDAEHFFKICKKMGVSLQTHIDNHSLSILDLLSMQKTPSTGIHAACSFKLLFKMLVTELKTQWEGATSGVVLMIESVSTLISLNDQQDLFLSFCRYCMTFHRALHRLPYGFITAIRSDIDKEEAKQIQSLFDFVIEPIPIDLISIANVDGKLKLLRHRLLSSEAQCTARSRDGQGTVLVGPPRSKPADASGDVTFSRELFFRVRDAGVVFFSDVDLHL